MVVIGLNGSKMTAYFDIVASGLGLIVISPFFLVLAIWIKLDSKGPVFYRQVRVGRFNKDFRIFKFRSMRVGADKGSLVTIGGHDPRVTRSGYFIRKFKLDELPQLINVLKGDMSFIGPRPWIPEYYKTMVNAQKVRTLVKPGITGLAQANGRNGISILKKIDLDVKYVKGFSFFMDIIVIFETIKAVLSKSDADAGKQIIHDELSELKAENKRFVV